jgi:hypothetical protein
MASTYSANNGMEKPAKGDLDGTWGDMVNENMDIIDRALSGVGTITLSGTTHTLTTTDGATTDGQFKVLVLSGSPSGTNTITISPNDQQKVYFVVNSSGQSAIFTQGSGANVTVPNGGADIIYADGNPSGQAVTSVLSKTLTTGNIIIPNAGNIGSASDTDAIAISSAGVVTMNQIPVFSAGINVSGGTIAGTLSTAAQTNITSVGTLTSLGVTNDVTVGDDLILDSNAAAIQFGDNQDVSLTHDQDSGLTLSAGANHTHFTITSTEDGANAGPRLSLKRDSANPADDDDLGIIYFKGENDADEEINYARIFAEAVDVSDGTEDGKLRLQVMRNGSQTTAIMIDDDEVEINATTADVNANLDVSGTYTGGGLMTTGGNIVIPNNGYIGSANDTDAMQINTTGNVYFSQGLRIEAGDTSLNTFYERGVIYMGRNQANDNYTDMDGKGIIIYDDQGTDGTTFSAVRVYNASGGDPVWQNKLSGTIKSEIESNGDFQSATNSYGATSDLNLKENIVDSGSQWNDIKAMRVRKFSFKEENVDAPNMIGVIAQELESAGMDKLVKTHLEFNPGDDGGDDVPVLDSSGKQKSHKSVKYSVIHMKALKALQEAMERIEALEAKVASLGG